MKTERYIGKKFGKLTPVSFSHKEGSRYYYYCLCDCGNTKTVSTSSLVAGYTKSCGCIAESLKIGSKRLVSVYSSMITRCHNQKHPNYRYYGAKGIKVCSEWVNDPRAFYKWALENGYANDLDLDRQNNNLGYSPENCRFVTHQDNMNNRTNTLFVNIDGVDEPLSVVAKRLNIGWGYLYRAVKVRGIPIKEAISTYTKKASLSP